MSEIATLVPRLLLRKLIVDSEIETVMRKIEVEPAGPYRQHLEAIIEGMQRIRYRAYGSMLYDQLYEDAQMAFIRSQGRSVSALDDESEEHGDT